MAGFSRLGRFPKGTQHARRWGDEVVQVFQIPARFKFVLALGTAT